METFLLVSEYAVCLAVWILICVTQSETLKYLYLLFADASVIPLSGKVTTTFHSLFLISFKEYVFNTEVRLFVPSKWKKILTRVTYRPTHFLSLPLRSELDFHRVVYLRTVYSNKGVFIILSQSPMLGGRGALQRSDPVWSTGENLVRDRYRTDIAKSRQTRRLNSRNALPTPCAPRPEEDTDMREEHFL